MVDSWHSLDRDGVLKGLEVGPDGLDEAEAKRRLERYGPNELVQKGRLSPWRILIAQFKNPLVIVLIIAAAISAGAATVEGSVEGWIDAAVIMVIVVLNAIMGFVQEYRAEKTMEALMELASPKVKVIRDGDEEEIPSKELVPGDIMVLETGDRISADGRVIESVNLKVNEASLTGESVPVTKRADAVLGMDTYIGERVNMVFSGCTVDYGRGTVAVTATGMETVLGGIAKMVQKAADETPLQRKLDRLGRQLGVGVLGISVFIFAFGIFQGVDLLDMFLTAVSLAVAAIPEGLPAVVTISLALGLQRMAKCNAVVRRLPAVESLGSATVICSDKTGTLTKGEMNIREVFTTERVDVTGEGFEPVGEFLVDGGRIDPLDSGVMTRLLIAGALCNDARLIREKDGSKWTVRGDTTEGTLLVTARKAGLDLEQLRREYPRTHEIPFSSEKKRMITVHEHEDRKLAFLKGAAESVVGLCDTRLVNGEEVRMDPDSRKGTLDRDGEMARRALRVLAIAVRDVTDEMMEESALERGFTLLGLVGMIDSPRKEAIEAIAKARKAGIKVKMITGDHALTAVAIAREMGIADDGRVLTGKQLDEMDEDELARAVEEVNVYARVAPENKVQILEVLKAKGEVVAMTGDGVNDAPALKRADIGIAMGITGTDVSKEAAEMVLADDNFASIVRAVQEGRGIYANIKKFVSFLLSCNAGEVSTMFLATFIFAEPETLPFLIPIQILWMNLVTDGFPALALGVEPTDPDVMTRPPRDPNEAPIDRRMAYRILIVGAIMAVGTLLAFQLEMWDTDDVDHSRTVAFCTLVMFQLLYVFSMRSSRKTLWQLGLRSNIKLVYAVAISLLLQIAVVYTPGLNDAFGTVPIGLSEWMIIVPIALTAFLASEVWKAFVYRGEE